MVSFSKQEKKEIKEFYGPISKRLSGVQKRLKPRAERGKKGLKERVKKATRRRRSPKRRTTRRRRRRRRRR